MMPENSKIPVISIVGPTASGKTKLGIYLSKNLNGEIISADSMQIYKEFNILSAKPSELGMEGVLHHFIDFLSVSKEYNVSKFVENAKKIILSLNKKNKLPILVGGTGLYVDSLLKNIDFSVNAFKNPKHEKLINLEKKTNKELFENLEVIDPISSEKIHVNDRKRLLRANYFFYESDFPISKQVENSKKILSPFESLKIGLNYRNRELLYENINKRVDIMLKNGLAEEVSEISKLTLSKTAKAAIGFKEILEYTEGKTSLKEAVENLKTSTRRYAKRQLTWFRRDKEIQWFYIEDYKNFDELKFQVGESVCSKLLKIKNKNEKNK